MRAEPYYSPCCHVPLERPDAMYGDPKKDWYCPGCDEVMLRSEMPLVKVYAGEIILDPRLQNDA